jgi:hypothetical protein
MSLKEKLRLTPDQFEQFDSLEPFQIEHLTNLHPAEQELIGELWRASKEVKETNFRGTVEDRFKAWEDLRIVQWKLAILDGRNPNHFHEMLDEKTIESFKKQLGEEKISFKFWVTHPTTGKRFLLEQTPDPRIEPEKK